MTTSERTKDTFALNLNQELGQMLCSFSDKLEIEIEKYFFKCFGTTPGCKLDLHVQPPVDFITRKIT